jgi:hypothetical protein
MPATATKKRSTKARLGYADVMDIAERPGDKRRLMPIGRGGAKVAPRKFHLNDDEVAELRQAHKDGDPLPNPQNRGSYFYIIEAGKKLGLNRKHSLKTVISTIRELMSDKETRQDDGKGNTTTAWQRFRDKSPATSNEENALDVEDRIVQNMEVLQRTSLTSTTPYGLKLLQVGQKVLKTHGCVIDLLKGDGKEIFFRLNTDAAAPTNELKRPRGGNAASRPSKVARSPRKAKATKVAAAAPKAARKPKTRAAKSDTVRAHAAPASDAPSATAASEPSADIATAV